MKNNQPVTQKEKVFAADTILLSTTDLKGKIKYANAGFTQVSEFTQDELYRQPHNIVRHPDMPPAAFESMWSRLKQGKPWIGIVKNRAKSGDHYWVNAYVAPVFEGGQVHEYQSVRRKATQAQIDNAQALYGELNAGKRPRALKAARLGFGKRLGLVLLLSLGVGVALAGYSPLLALLLATGLGLGGLSLILKPFNALVEQASGIIDDPLATAVYCGRQDELGKLSFALQYLLTETGGAVGRMADSAESIQEQIGRAHV